MTQPAEAPRSDARARESITDILCIGAQKASTSWLHHVLNAHPRTHAFPNSRPVTSTNKEAHFWDWNRKRGIDWYRTLMTPPDPAMLSLDFTPEYSTLSEADIAECKRLNPGARVIYVLRDPLARAVSAIRMHTKWATDDAAADAVQVPFDDAFVDLVGRAGILPMGSYVANYQRWARHYDDILVLNYEDIRRDPHGVIARVFAHCGLEIDTMPPEAKAEFDKRMAKRVWASVPYALTPEAVHFLHGLMWPKRRAAEGFFGVTFEEYREILGHA